MTIPARQHGSIIKVVYTVAFLDLFSASMITTCLSTYLTDELKMTATTAGLVGSIYGIVQFFSCPVIGSWSDNYGYKRILSVCLFCCIPAYSLLSSPFWMFVIVARILAGSFKHTQTLSRTYLATFASDSEKMQAYGRLNAMGNVGFVLGPAVEAWLLANYGYEAVFYCTAFTFLLNGILVSSLLPSSTNGSEEVKNAEATKSSVRSSFHITSILDDFWSSTHKVDWSRQWDLMLTRFLLSFTVLLYRSSYSWMMQDKFGIDPATIGWVTSYQGVVAFFASIGTNYFAIFYFGDNVRLYEHATLLMFFALIGLLFAGSFYFYVLFLMPFCISTSIMRVLTLELTTERCHKSEVGFVLGVSASAVSFARALSPAIGGILHDWNRDATGIFCLIIVISSWAVTNVYTRWYTYGEEAGQVQKSKHRK